MNKWEEIINNILLKASKNDNVENSRMHSSYVTFGSIIHATNCTRGYKVLI